MQKLSDQDIRKRLAAAPEWTHGQSSIERTYQFKDFLAAMRFVNAVAAHAERVQHHPDMLIRWNKVTLTLSTHDAGGLTAKDFDSAATYDAMAT
jgi:4a-hydroxytetrahydrobiopterin dehydratase